MLKQPKYFYKSKSHHQAETAAVSPEATFEVPVVVSPTPLEEPLLSPRRTHFTSALLFGIGFICLSSIAGLIALPAYKKAHPPLALAVPPLSGQAVLGVAGGVGNGLQYEAKTVDARVDIIQSFLSRYNSPLKPYDHYAQVLVDAADRYGLDYRLLPAIMMQESNLCKTADPAIHNCLGFGIHKRGTLGFDTYEDSFDRAARELKANYIDEGLTTPEQIMHKYTPSSDGSWANSVNQWIAEMEYNSHEKGLSEKTNADLTAYTGK